MKNGLIRKVIGKWLVYKTIKCLPIKLCYRIILILYKLVTETSITRRYIKLTLYVVLAALILMRRVVLLATKPGLTLSKT